MRKVKSYAENIYPGEKKKPERGIVLIYKQDDASLPLELPISLFCSEGLRGQSAATPQSN